MPDISICQNGRKCPRVPFCYRYLAIPDSYQSYMDFYKKGKRCNNFLPLQPGDKIFYLRRKDG